MRSEPVFINVVADLIVAAIAAAVVFALILLMWVTWRLTVRAVSRIRPARKPGYRQIDVVPGSRRQD